MALGAVGDLRPGAPLYFLRHPLVELGGAGHNRLGDMGRNDVCGRRRDVTNPADDAADTEGEHNERDDKKRSTESGPLGFVHGFFLRRPC